MMQPNRAEFLFLGVGRDRIAGLIAAVIWIMVS